MGPLLSLMSLTGAQDCSGFHDAMCPLDEENIIEFDNDVLDIALCQQKCAQNNLCNFFTHFENQCFPQEYFDVVYDTATGSGKGEDYFSISETLLKKSKKNVVINGGIWTWVSYFLGLQKENRRLTAVDMNSADLEALAHLYNTKQISPPVIFKTLKLDSEGVQEGFQILQSRRTVGKIVFRI